MINFPPFSVSYPPTLMSLARDMQNLVSHILNATAKETDPIYIASPSATITQAQITAWDAMSPVSHDAVTIPTDSGLNLTGQEISMGTPGTITLASSNSVSGSGHTHAISGITTTSLKGTTVTGTIDGINTTFTLGHELTEPTFVFWNGLKIAAANYSIASTTLELATAPEPDDILEVYGVY